MRLLDTTKILRGMFVDQQTQMGVVATLLQTVQFKVREQWRGHMKVNEPLELMRPDVHHKPLQTAKVVPVEAWPTRKALSCSYLPDRLLAAFILVSSLEPAWIETFR
jgi:hypothetical protein